MSALTCPECKHEAADARDLAKHCVDKHDYAPSDGMRREQEKASHA